MKPALITSFFVLAVALIAAVIGDATVEKLSNAAVFYHGHYTDQSSADLVPVALLGALAVIGLFAAIVLRQAREAGFSPRAVLLSSARRLAPATVVRLLPLIFGVQIATLFVMETAEQALVYGHLFGGTLWLGGPIAVSLGIHALLALACALLAARAVQHCAAQLVGIIRLVLAFFVAICAPSLRVAGRSGRRITARSLRVSSAIVDRGPPALTLG